MRAGYPDIKLFWIWITITLAIAVMGCQGEKKETPTKGKVTIVVSEALEPLIAKEREEFVTLYQNAQIELQSASDREAIAKFFNVESTKVVATARPLNNEERDVAKRTNMNLGEYKIALDAIAILVNAGNRVSRLRTTQLDSIYTGAITNWKAVGGSLGQIQVCLPSRNSGDFETVQATVLHGANFAPPARLVSSFAEMLQYVSDHPNALGMIGLVRLAEKNDSVKVLELSDPSAPDSLGIRGQYFAPFQAHVYRGFYPITREIFFYSKADEYGVAAGFITFVCSAPGQKIVLNSGLVPATMPVRLVELTNKGVTQ